MPHGTWGHRTIYQLSLIGTSFGQQIVNVHHFEVSSVQEATFLTDTLRIAYATTLANLWHTNNKTNWVQAHGSDYTLTLLRMQVLEVPGQFEHRLTPVEIIPSAPVTGAAPTAAEDTTTAAVIKWRSTQAGKSHRGRTYVGPVPHGWQADGMLAAAGVTDIGAYATGMINKYGVNGSESANVVMTVYSAPYNQGEYGWVRGSGPNREFYFPPDYSGDSTNILNHAIDPTLRTQRRRELGRGA